ncbi:hypothetical protein IFM89_027035 [Coptis chinensis]|uniref:Uncharacterized protein n=1 Tax=Coptis chinensis TaxID=261450 RepID=A0A835HP16_9MAGN|nr:hypothetical protein IFM89_027035 [Coptis chinensis]
MQEGMEGNPMAGTMKTFSRIIGVLTIPFTMSFPKITSNIFSLMYGIVIKRPDVKKFLNLHAFPVTSTPAPKPAFSLLSALKTSNPTAEGPASLNMENSKHSDGKISSSSVISQRLRILEKQVKGRKKNKTSISEVKACTAAQESDSTHKCLHPLVAVSKLSKIAMHDAFCQVIGINTNFPP